MSALLLASVVMLLLQFAVNGSDIKSRNRRLGMTVVSVLCFVLWVILSLEQAGM